jgi:dienelactone hydrolase
MREWEQARRVAFVQDILSAFSRRRSGLLPFEDVRSSLRLRGATYRGLQDVPVQQIVGSVNRYRDFTRAFFPREGVARQRWGRIAMLSSAPDGGLPPVELYKVGELYFVRDGHHRVSVARQQKKSLIDAYVWEYESRVALDHDVSPEELLLKAAQAAFLEQTDADHYLPPDMHIELTDAEGYEDLSREIEAFQVALSQIDQLKVPYGEAVAQWCAMCYAPIVEIIRQRGMLPEFPGRTETDLYLWLYRNREELDARYGHDVLIEEAADDLTERLGKKASPTWQVMRRVGQVAGGVGGLGARLARSIGAEGRPPDQEEKALAAALLSSVTSAIAASPAFRFDGTTRNEWAEWQPALREELWQLLGVGDYPWRPYGAAELGAEAGEWARQDGLWRQVVWLSTEPHLRVPATVIRPEGAREPLPAVLILPGHGTMAQAAGLEPSEQEVSAPELARAGLIAVAVEPRGFGRLGVLEHLEIDGLARLVGRTWFGLVLQDAMRAVDYLATRPDVDPTRIAATGTGLGGGLALYLAALDERVQAVVIGNYLRPYVQSLLDEESCPCSVLNGVLQRADAGDVAALLAPRPALFVNSRSDPGRDRGVRESFSVAQHAYQVLGVPRRARFVEPAGVGRCFDSQLAAGWLHRWLARGPQG